MTFLGLEVGSWASWFSGFITTLTLIVSLIASYRASHAKLMFFSGGLKYLPNYVESSNDKTTYTNNVSIFVHNKRSTSSKIKRTNFFYKDKNNKKFSIDPYVLNSVSKIGTNGYYEVTGNDYKEIMVLDLVELDRLIGINNLKESKVFLEFVDIKDKKYSLEIIVNESNKI